MEDRFPFPFSLFPPLVAKHTVMVLARVGNHRHGASQEGWRPHVCGARAEFPHDADAQASREDGRGGHVR